MTPSMRPCTLFLRRLTVAGLVWATAAGAQAQIAAKSPFLPPAGSANAPTQNAPLEFRAMMETPEGMLYRIYDPARKVGSWAKANEKNSDFNVLVKQYDAERKTLTVEHDGRTLTLPERESKIVSSGAAAQVMPPPIQMPVPGQNMSPAVAQTAVVNPSPADEQRRLEAVAAEVARRRALREQASQQIGQPGLAPAVAVPQMVQPQVVQPLPPRPQQNFQPQNNQNGAQRGQNRGGGRQR